MSFEAERLLPMDLLSLHDLGVHLSLTGTLGALLVVVAGWWLQRSAGSKTSDKPAAAD